MLTLVRDMHGARVAHATDPVDLEAAGSNSRSDGTGEMSAALAPIEARPTERTARRARLAQVDAKADEKLFSRRCHHAAVVGERDVVPLHNASAKDTPRRPAR